MPFVFRRKRLSDPRLLIVRFDDGRRLPRVFERNSQFTDLFSYRRSGFSAQFRVGVAKVLETLTPFNK